MVRFLKKGEKVRRMDIDIVRGQDVEMTDSPPNPLFLAVLASHSEPRKSFPKFSIGGVFVALFDADMLLK